VLKIWGAVHKGQMRFYTPPNYSRSEEHASPITYYSGSALRNITNPCSENIHGYVDILCEGLMINSFLNEVVANLGLDPRHHQELPAKFSGFREGVPNFLRDCYFVLDSQIFQTHPSIVLDEERHIDQQSVAVDLASLGYEVQQAPIFTEGGNICPCVDRNGAKVIIFAISDYYYVRGNFVKKGDVNQNAVFRRNFMAHFCDEDEVVELNYNEYSAAVKKWFKKFGYDVIIAERDVQKNLFSDIYHLDIFCNVARLQTPDQGRKDFLILDPDCVTGETLGEFKKKFGEENIIYITQEERKKLCTNFIQYGNSLILSHPDTPQSFIKKMTDRGFQVTIPPMLLSMWEDGKDGARCHTQVAPLSASVVAESSNEQFL
jgi:hypothetical protein